MNSSFHEDIFRLYTEQTTNAQPALSPMQPPNSNPPSAVYDWKNLEHPMKDAFIDSVIESMKSYISGAEHSNDSYWDDFDTPGEVLKDFIKGVELNATAEEEQL